MRLSPIKERTTLSHEAYIALRSAILARRLVAGEKLIVRKLSEGLGLSATPIKEALAALAREGLVEARAHRGYYIPQATPEDIEEIYALREVIEGLSARLAATRADTQLVAAMKKLLAKQRIFAAKGDFERYGDIDLAFHRALWEASGSRRLMHLAEAIAGQIRLFISTSAKVPGRLPASLEEHSALLRAISAGDPRGAEIAMRTHVRRAGAALRSRVNELEPPTPTQPITRVPSLV